MPNPKYAVSVVIENGESGGSVAGPVAIAVLNSLIEEWKGYWIFLNQKFILIYIFSLP